MRTDAAVAAPAPDASPVAAVHGPWRRSLRRFLRRPLGVAALTVFLGLLVVCVFAGRLAPYGVGDLDLAHVNQAHGPTLAGHHFFGTDYLGRDLFSQTLYGLHTTMLLALAVTAAATAFGILTGAWAGYAGGWLDLLLMRGVDLIVTLPVLAVVFASLVYFMPLTPRKIALVLMLYLWTGVARVVRASCASLREREFVEAAHAAGASARRIVLRHLLPNCSGAVAVAATTTFGIAVTVEATADFFNVGTTQVSVGGPTLGNLLADSLKFGPIAQAPWWTYTFPAAVLVLLLVCVNFLGDSLDDALVS